MTKRRKILLIRVKKGESYSVLLYKIGSRQERSTPGLLHDDFVLVKVCNYANPTQVGFMYMQELCFLVTRDAFLCHVLSGVSHHGLETRLIWTVLKSAQTGFILYWAERSKTSTNQILRRIVISFRRIWISHPLEGSIRKQSCKHASRGAKFERVTFDSSIEAKCSYASKQVSTLLLFLIDRLNSLVHLAKYI